MYMQVSKSCSLKFKIGQKRNFISGMNLLRGTIACERERQSERQFIDGPGEYISLQRISFGDPHPTHLIIYSIDLE